MEQLSPGDERSADAQVSALRSELERIYRRIEGQDRSVDVLQFGVLLFGGSVLAASQYAEAIAALPVFWNVWFLYVVMVDVDTIKLSAYAESLETEINRRLHLPVYGWEARLAQRGDVRPLIYDANYLFYLVLNVVSWSIAIAVFVHEHQYVGAVVLAVLWGLIWGVALRTYAERELIRRRALEVAQANGPAVLRLSHSRRAQVYIYLLGSAFPAVCGAVVVFREAWAQSASIGLVVIAVPTLMLLEIRLPATGTRSV